MAEIKRYPFVRHLRSDASVHIARFRKGRLVRSGRGIAFWFIPASASVAELPMDDRDMVLFFNGRSKDFQAVTVQGNLTWRVADANVLNSRIDFSINLANGRHQSNPIEQIEGLLTGMAQQIATQYCAESNVHHLIDSGIEPLRQRLEANLTDAPRLKDMGLEIVAIRLAAIAPTAELERALQTPTFEALQQKADQAVFERRALAVEKERAIAENEMANKIELARRETQLISQQARQCPQQGRRRPRRPADRSRRYREPAARGRARAHRDGAGADRDLS